MFKALYDINPFTQERFLINMQSSKIELFIRKSYSTENRGKLKKVVNLEIRKTRKKDLEQFARSPNLIRDTRPRCKEHA